MDFKIKKHYQVEVNFAQLTAGKYYIPDQPDLRNVTTCAIEAYINTGLSISYNQKAVVPVGSGIVVTLSLIDATGSNLESVYNMPYTSFIRSLNGGIYTQFKNFNINWQQSYLTILNTTGLTAAQSAVFSVYYEGDPK